MIGIDTNILVRVFVEDDASQAQAAKKLMETASKRDQLFISSYTLMEFAWVLKVKKFKRQEIYEAIITLTDSPGVTIGQREVVLSAAEKFYKGKADFGDYMIFSEGEHYGAKNLKTFDKALIRELHQVTLP
ncbi:MAG: type II toxin-antitoxin system VapC family toxin [Alphaproteobacteria bacterium]